jgi:Fe-S cluster assembly protein SufD
MTQAVTEGVSLRDRFDRLEAELSKGAPAWLRTLRRAALARFETLGFPTAKDEEWRNTPVASVADLALERAGEAALDLRDTGIAPASGPRLVFVNGRLDRKLTSLADVPAGVEVGSLADVLRTAPERIEPHLGRVASFEEHAFRALNTAFFEDGAYVFLPRGAVVEHPIEILHLLTRSEHATVHHPRTLVVAGDGSQAIVSESYAGFSQGACLTNAVTEIVVGANASIEHLRSEADPDAAIHLGTTLARQGRDSRFTSHVFSVGAAFARHDTGSVLAESGGSCLLNGLYLADGTRVVDHHTFLDHAAPHCDSLELYKGIVGGRARAIFNGRIIVRPDAQKTDAKQSNKNLLLSDEAFVHTRPQLEIYANDVKCTHGATIGRLDADAMFYLRSRGIGEAEARDLLIHAFLRDLVDRVRAPSLRGVLSKLVEERLPRSGKRAEAA